MGTRFRINALIGIQRIPQFVNYGPVSRHPPFSASWPTQAPLVMRQRGFFMRAQMSLSSVIGNSRTRRPVA